MFSYSFIIFVYSESEVMSIGVLALSHSCLLVLNEAVFLNIPR